MSVILCSQSPQRQAILRQLGVEPVVMIPDIVELDDGEPEFVAVENAERKLGAIDRPASHVGLVIACDTLLDVDGEPVGKPTNHDDAEAMLLSLRGRSHDVIGGLAIGNESGNYETAVVRTRVTFRQFSRRVLTDYLATDEWQGRAGGYAIQSRGAALVESVEGDYLNVVGLPVAAMFEIIERWDWLGRFTST